MGKSITRDFTIAAGVGLVVGIAVAIYVVNVHRPSEFEEAILLTLVHELWVIDKLFDVNWTKQTFLVVHEIPIVQ